MAWLPWQTAWHNALYAADRGFYVTRGGPSAHFSTATHGPVGAVMAEALLRLWERERGGLPSVIVDVGAGRGELLTHLQETRDSMYGGGESDSAIHRIGGGVRLVGVDVVERPPGLAPEIEWVRSPGGAELPDALEPGLLTDALVIAHEWLDVVPCAIAEVDESGVLRTVLVDPATGEEELGDPLDGPDHEWAGAYWPATDAGARIEVGRSRDLAWQNLTSRVSSGLCVAIDYAHVGTDRPGEGTLIGYRSGTQVAPVPDGSCDITAHVAIDSLGADRVERQRDLLQELGIRAELPPHELSRTNPAAYVHALARASAEGALLDPRGYGAFWWAISAPNGGS